MKTADMESAFYASDPSWDGRFVAAVRTTGIFCRPSCTARKPLPANVSYLPDATAAELAGYRACLRCHPAAATPIALRSILTAIGPMIIGASAEAVVLADFSLRPMMPAQLRTVARLVGPASPGESTLLDALESQLREFLTGKRRSFDLPVHAPGSPLQERVWAELGRVTYGETITYGQLACRVGLPTASRAIGRANGANRLALIIPCHRVIATGGRLGGYGGGLAAKQYLLELERRIGAGAV